MFKKCPICKIEKPLTSQYFHARSNMTPPFQHYCKECKKAKDKTYHGEKKYKDYQRSPLFVFSQIKYQAKKRKLCFKLTTDYYLSNLANKPCHYCDNQNTKHWIDRIDSGIGYITSNVLPCCELCNKMKMALPLNVWLGQCKKIVHHNNL